MQKEEKWFDLTELSNRIAGQFNADPEEIREIFKAGFDEIAKEVGRAENPVILDNVGTFYIQGRQARNVSHPQKRGETVNIPAHQKVKFKAAKEFKEIVKANLPDIFSSFGVK
jgi:nucleoid DNA-binding protein